MKIKENESKMKTCILIVVSAGRVRPNKGDNCIASDCFAYWRWVDESHEQGYCSLGGKPEF